MVDRICYDFILTETWWPEFSFKNAKFKKFHNDYELLPWPYDIIPIQNPSHMLLIFTLSFVKLLWSLLRFSSCTHDQDSRTPIIKKLTLTLRVTQKHVFHPPKYKNSVHLSWALHSKVFICQKEYGAILKKRETHEALKIAKEKKKKNGTHEGSKCWKKKKKR